MSEGLEALKEVKECLFWSDEGLKKINIIEKELKEKDELAQALSIVTCENGDLLKYKKALEIIKNKFTPYCVANCDNGKVRIWLGHDKFIDVSQEEYDLLKEIL